MHPPRRGARKRRDFARPVARCVKPDAKFASAPPTVRVGLISHDVHRTLKADVPDLVVGLHGQRC
jgi:hypothetical protein